MCPVFITYALLQIFKAMWMFCSTSRTVVPCSLSATMRSKIVLVRMGLRPREASSIMTSFGRAMTARPMASICCSPPLSRPALPLHPLFQHREQSKDPLQGLVVVGPCPWKVGAQPQILENSECLEQPPSFRHDDDAPIDAMLRVHVPRSSPPKNTSLDRVKEARYSLEQGGLPGAVRTDEGHDGAFLDLQGDVPRARTSP